MAENTREIILDVLLTLERGEAYSNQLIKSVLDKYDYLEARDKSFIKRVAEGTIERRIELDYYLNSFSSVPVKKMKPLIRCLMRMSVYQLIYMDSVPDSAVCNEACKLAVKRKFGNLKGFVNGVLRSVARGKNQLPMPDSKKEPVQYLSVQYSMPEWLVQRWLGCYGEDITTNLLKGLLEIHPVSIRFRSDLSADEVDRVIRELEQSGVKVTKGRYLEYGYFLENIDNISMLPGFEEGLWTVQDVSSAMAVEAAEIAKNDFVIDACAAPGGKSMYAAEKAMRVLSRDVSEEKADYIRENIARMKYNNVDVQVWDATCFDEKLNRQADVLLLDVPCSGLGIMGKKRDIKYNVSPDGLEQLQELQKKIVSTCCNYVKSGGTLIYSTCTINQFENEAMVKYIAEELGFEPVSLEGVLNPALMEEKRCVFQEKQKRSSELFGDRVKNEVKLSAKEEAACIQFLPGYMESDGFFLAKFRRPDKEEG